ncbi:MAG: hypothetical protein CL872_00545 [Dehalococcoidaceae bacterium]|nr:hypothetical protein [Dehalococcoidaceae bacterium]
MYKFPKNNTMENKSLNIAASNLPALEQISPDNYDPNKPSITHDIIVQLFEPLFKYDNNYHKKQSAFSLNDLNGLLGSSISMNKDGTKYKIELKETYNAYGLQITSSDVLASWLHAYEKKQIGRWVAMMGSVPRQKSFMNILDKNSLEFNLEEPNLLFPHLLTMMVPPIVSKHFFSGNSDDIYNHGFGPYKIKKFDSNHIQLVSNTKHWNQKAHFNKINYFLIPNEHRIEALLKGEIDLIFNPTQKEIIESMNHKNTAMYSSQGNTRIALQISENTKSPIDKNIRKAISLIIPYKKIIKSIYSGHATTWKGLVPSSVRFAREFDLGEENISLAKSLMNKTDYKNLSYNLIVDDSSKECIEIASIIKKAVSTINIKINIQLMPRKEFKSKQMTNNFEISLDKDLYRCNEIGYVLPHDFGDKKHGITNWINYNNEEVNLLFAKAKKTIDYDERIKMYDNVQDILVNELPWIPIVQPEFNILHKNTIHGFNWEARLSGYPRYSDLIFQKNNN